MGKYSKVSSSTEWRSGENVVLRLMECLTPAVSFDTFLTISNLFVCLPALELTSLEQQVCSTTQMRYHWEPKASKKKERCLFEQRTSSKKAA